jgi:hypothetical protein
MSLKLVDGFIITNTPCSGRQASKFFHLLHINCKITEETRPMGLLYTVSEILLFISEGDEKKSSNQTVKSAKLKNTDM